MARDLIDARIYDALKNGVRVVTAERTQARHLRHIYARIKQSENITAWPTPRLLTWQDWIEYLADEIRWSGYVSPVGQRLMLTPGQEQLLWERVIIDSGERDTLDNLGGTASRARQAWGLIQSYRLPDPKTAKYPNADVRAFSGWMRDYHARTSKRMWMDHARLSDAVAPALRGGAIESESDVVLFGFEKFTPQQRVLLKIAETAGTRFHLIKPKRAMASLQRAEFTDREQELTTAARWVRTHLSQEQPGMTAVLIPQLDRQLDTVTRVFDDVLSPGSSLPTSSLTARPYTLSLERPFIRHRLVEGAVVMLRFALTSSNFADASSFLRSPFLRAAGAEQPMRARFEIWLRQNNVDTLYPGELQKLLEIYSQRMDSDAAQSVLSSLLSSIQPLIAKSRGQHPMTYWASLFRDMLNVCGWPGDTAPNQVEFQAAEKFRDALNELSRLEFMAPVCGAETALSYLGRIVQSTRFRPRMPETNVQIMQPEQAFGLRFDHVWVAGWTQQNWPEAPRANPFLPVNWQRKNDIPGSSSEVQLDHAIAITENLCSAGNDVVFSHAIANQDEPLGESPLVRSVPAALTQNFEVAEVTDYCQVIRAATDLIEFNDAQGPKMADVHHAKGGSTIFRLQSQCGFRAFAQLRLGVKPWTVPRPGVSALDKGQHLHKALEFIWNKLGDLVTLKEVHGTEHLENQVYREVEIAINYQDRKRIRKLSLPERNLEQRRLVRQILDILAIEHTRPDFKVVGHEVQRKITIGDLVIDARIDRIDDVAEHGLLLIDYKLGKYTSGGWRLPRMMEPQLPLYTQAYTEPVAGIAFINGKRGDVGIEGVSRNHAVGGKIRSIEQFAGKQDPVDWEGQLGRWREELERLAEEYVAGNAQVDPAGPHVCRYCDLKSFCRINERRLRDDDVAHSKGGPAYD